MRQARDPAHGPTSRRQRRRHRQRFGGGGEHGGPFTYVDQAAAKSALDTFSIGLAREQAEQGIRVNCLRPGITMTGISRDYAEQHPEWLDWVLP